MKKTVSLALVFSFLFALTAQMPVLAEDLATSTNATTTDTTVSTSTSSEATSTAVTGNNLEKITSTEYAKYFREIRKIGNDFFGIRKPAAEIEKLKQTNTETSTQEKTHEIVKASSTVGMEKIPSTEHMNLFEKIVKIGHDLFGVKKNNPENKPTTIKASSTSENKTTGLEKISSLNDVRLFERITKIGNDLFGLRIKRTYLLPVMSTELITCASNAIDAKDSKIGESFTTAAADITSAISTRGTCQKAALALSSERQGTLNTCNKAFNEAHKIATDKTKNIQKEAWTVYNNSLKTCATTAGAAEIKIEDGGQNISETLNK